MLSSFPFALLVGSVLGTLAGLGVGGGSLLVMWMTLILGADQSTARTINLLFFLPAAVIASLFRWKQGTLKIKKLLPGIIAGCISAAIFSILSSTIPTEFLRKAFGVLLLVTGTRELLYKSKN